MPITDEIDGEAGAVPTDSVGKHELGLLVPSNYVFGMARMYQMRTDGNTGGVQVFRDEGEAERWLEGEQ